MHGFEQFGRAWTCLRSVIGANTASLEMYSLTPGLILVHEYIHAGDGIGGRVRFHAIGLHESRVRVE